jgi:hypothetical protein
MEEGIEIDCYNCRLLYPGMKKCGVCGGAGKRVESAPKVNEVGAAEILKDALDRMSSNQGTILSGRSMLVKALIQWQMYGVPYVTLVKKQKPGTPEHLRELNKIRDQIVKLVREMDKL